ncbi:MAG TPA: hypothetical protein VFA11_17955 [Acidimicrobiales bacterium]|nr:hypothetical protein [Acidimicrobiales bacterium]
MNDQAEGSARNLAGTLPLILGSLLGLALVFIIALNNSQRGFTGSGSTSGYLGTTTTSLPVSTGP